MKKIITIGLVGMFVILGCGSLAIGAPEPVEPIRENQAPTAPIIFIQISNNDRNCYLQTFHSEDPDGDNIYYEITWSYLGVKDMVAASPDDPTDPWLGPYESGENIELVHTCYQTGNYEVTIRAKDTNGNIGQPTTMQINHRQIRLLQSPFFSKILEKYPTLTNFLAKIM